MWWWSISEGVQEEPEPLFSLFVGDIADSEDSFLQFDIMDSYRTGGDLITIEDEIVQISLHATGGGLQRIEIL